MKAAVELSNIISDSKAACAVLGVPRANFYRFKNRKDVTSQETKPLSPLAL